MRAEAFGAGIRPDEFYKLDIQDYALWREGFLQNRVWFENVMRLSVSNLLQPYLKEGKTLDPLQLWECYGDDELKERIKDIRKQRQANLSEQAMRVLQMHQQGGFEYIKEGGKIIQKWIDKEKDQNAKEN